MTIGAALAWLIACDPEAGQADADEAGDESSELDEPCMPGDAPTLELGQGEAAFMSFADGATLELVHGPQGGVHTFMALEARYVDASVELEGNLRGYLDGVQVGASYPYLNFRCQAATQELAGGWQVWGLLLIWDAPPEDLHLQSVHIEAEFTDASGVVVSASKDAILHDPLQN